MERSQIIKKFLDSGYQLSSDALELLVENPKKVDEFFEKANQKTIPLIITSDFLNTFLEVEAKKEKVTPEEYSSFFSKRFEAIRAIFSKRLDLVNLISINKISQKTKKFSIIGMVKEKNPQNNAVVLEDKTGEVEIQLQDKDILNDIVEDEVLSAVCKKSDGEIFAESIFFPDVQMKREINKTKEDVYCFFISDLHMDSESFNRASYLKYIEWLEKQKEKINIFVLGDISSNVKDVEKFLSDIPKNFSVYIIKGEIDSALEPNILPNPSIFQVEDVKLFLFHNPRLNDYISLWDSPDKAISNLVKKRHLDPIFTPESKISQKDAYLLDVIPDVIVAGHTHIPSTTNYKGVTILTTGSFVSQPIFWLINLRTREIFKIDFS